MTGFPQDRRILWEESQRNESGFAFTRNRMIWSLWRRSTLQENDLGAYFREGNGCYAFGNASQHNKEDHMKPYFSFQWHITDECDQRCKHCCIFSENCNKKPDEMS